MADDPDRTTQAAGQTGLEALAGAGHVEPAAAKELTLGE
jgi:hypothetical protein